MTRDWQSHSRRAPEAGGFAAGAAKPASGLPALRSASRAATRSPGMMKLPVTPNRLITNPTIVPSTPTAGAPHSSGKTGISAVMTVGGTSAWSLTNSDPISGSGTF